VKQRFQTRVAHGGSLSAAVNGRGSLLLASVSTIFVE
jgi:hypothetical protein